MKKFFSFSLLFFLIIFSFTKLNASEWSKSYGGGEFDFAYSAFQTSDGGFIIAGDTTSFGSGGNDLVLIKINSNGGIEWKNTYGGTSIEEGTVSIVPTSDRGFVVLAKTESFGVGNSDIWILKMDASGNIIWQKTFGASGYDSNGDIKQTPDGGYIVVGNTTMVGTGDYNAYILRLNSNGEQIWQKSIGRLLYDDYVFSVAISSDGNYYISGATEVETGDYDVWVLKLNSRGGIIWQKNYGGSLHDFANSIISTQTGCVLAGTTYSSGSEESNVWILNLDANGNILWQRTYVGSDNEGANHIIETNNGYVFAGWTSSFGRGNNDALLVNIDKSGNILWQKSYGGQMNELFNGIIKTADGGYLLTGGTSSFGLGGYDMWVIKTDANGMTVPSVLINNTNLKVSTPIPKINDTSWPFGDVTYTPQSTSLRGIGINSSMIPTSSHLKVTITDTNCERPYLAGSVLFSNPSGASCSSKTGNCIQIYRPGTRVTLTAQPFSDYTFEDWGEDASNCGKNPVCSIEVDNYLKVEARFSKTLCIRSPLSQ